MADERPAPWLDTPPPGFYFAAVADENWRLLAGRPCRAGASRARKACGEPSVAALKRPYRGSDGQWWAYCGEHMYGRWIEDGKVMHWILLPTGSPS